MSDYFKTNEKLWNSNVTTHANSDFYKMEAFKKGATSLKSIELEALGDVSGKRLLHLQCHFGQDSLSWARKGAKVTAVDFSKSAITLARELNEELSLDATFIQSNVYDLEQHLEGEFDIIFTSYGVLCWLDNLDKWAGIVVNFLAKGGVFYIAEFHPILMMYEFESHTLKYDYFNPGKPYLEVSEGSYAERDAPLKNDEYTWSHSLEEIMMSLLNRGLILEEFKEFPYSPYNCFSNMKEVETEQFVFDTTALLPHIFSLKMHKPTK